MGEDVGWDVGVGPLHHLDSRLYRSLQVFRTAVEAWVAGETAGGIHGELEIGETEVVLLQKGLEGSVDLRIIAGEVVGRVHHDVPGEGQLQDRALCARRAGDGQQKRESDKIKSTDCSHLFFIVVLDPHSTRAGGKKARGGGGPPFCLLDFSGVPRQ